MVILTFFGCLMTVFVVSLAFSLPISLMLEVHDKMGAYVLFSGGSSEKKMSTIDEMKSLDLKT